MALTVIEGNAFYEIDEECLKCAEEKRDEEIRQSMRSGARQKDIQPPQGRQNQ